MLKTYAGLLAMVVGVNSTLYQDLQAQYPGYLPNLP